MNNIKKWKQFNEEVEKYHLLNEESLPPNKDHQYFIDIFKKLGYNIIKNISGGHYGYCYLTDKNTVLKYTSDKFNAAAAYILKGKKLEYLVDCYNSYIINHNDHTFYIIEMEYLDTKKVNLNKLNDAFKKFNYKMSYFNTIHPNSYVRDFLKILKEADKYGIRVDLRNTGNFTIKNNHLCAIDLGYISHKTVDKIEIINI